MQDLKELKETKTAQLTNVSASIRELKTGWNRFSLTRSSQARQELRTLTKQQASLASDLSKLNGAPGEVIQQVLKQKIECLRDNVAIVKASCMNDERITPADKFWIQNGNNTC